MIINITLNRAFGLRSTQHTDLFSLNTKKHRNVIWREILGFDGYMYDTGDLRFTSTEGNKNDSVHA